MKIIREKDQRIKKIQRIPLEIATKERIRWILMKRPSKISKTKSRWVEVTRKRKEEKLLLEPVVS